MGSVFGSSMLKAVSLWQLIHRLTPLRQSSHLLLSLGFTFSDSFPILVGAGSFLISGLVLAMVFVAVEAGSAVILLSLPVCVGPVDSVVTTKLGVLAAAGIAVAVACGIGAAVGVVVDVALVGLAATVDGIVVVVIVAVDGLGDVVEAFALLTVGTLDMAPAGEVLMILAGGGSDDGVLDEFFATVDGSDDLVLDGVDVLLAAGVAVVALGVPAVEEDLGLRLRFRLAVPPAEAPPPFFKDPASPALPAPPVLTPSTVPTSTCKLRKAAT